VRRQRPFGTAIVSTFAGLAPPRFQRLCQTTKNAAESTIAAAATKTFRRMPPISCDGSIRSVSIQRRPML